MIDEDPPVVVTHYLRVVVLRFRHSLTMNLEKTSDSILELFIIWVMVLQNNITKSKI